MNKEIDKNPIKGPAGGNKVTAYWMYTPLPHSGSHSHRSRSSTHLWCDTHGIDHTQSDGMDQSHQLYANQASEPLYYLYSPYFLIIK